jgi:hypothetical protein
MYMLSVIYDDVADKAALARTDSPTAIGDEPEPIVTELLDKAESDSPMAINKILPSKGIKDIRSKPKKGYPAEAASIEIDALSPDQIGANLARLERLLRAGEIPDAEVEGWLEWVEEVHIASEYGSPNHGRAYRLLQDDIW